MIQFNPIGLIHSPFQKKSATPIQSARSKARGTVEVFHEFMDGLDGLEEFSHIYLLYFFHCSSGYALKVKPFLDNYEHGLFTTRHPCRPNPIGLSVVELLNRKDNVLEIMGVDVLNGTPLLDIKPYIPDFDYHPVTRIGWYQNRKHQ